MPVLRNSKRKAEELEEDKAATEQTEEVEQQEGGEETNNSTTAADDAATAAAAAAGSEKKDGEDEKTGEEEATTDDAEQLPIVKKLRTDSADNAADEVEKEKADGDATTNKDGEGESTKMEVDEDDKKDCDEAKKDSEEDKKDGEEAKKDDKEEATKEDGEEGQDAKKTEVIDKPAAQEPANPIAVKEEEEEPDKVTVAVKEEEEPVQPIYKEEEEEPEEQDDGAEIPEESDEAWNKHLFDLLIYKNQYKTLHVQATYGPELHVWVNIQRRLYRRNRKDPNSVSAATQKRLVALDAINFPFTLRGAAHWDRYFAKLHDFHKKHGHCLVPRLCEFPGLGDWVIDQRRQYKLMMQGKPSVLDPERQRKLEDLGFVWIVRNRPEWHNRYHQLLEYREKHGDTKVPQHYKEIPGLGKWVAKQREQYRLLSQGKHSFLTPDRLEKLNDAGFVWSVRKDDPDSASLPPLKKKAIKKEPTDGKEQEDEATEESKDESKGESKKDSKDESKEEAKEESKDESKVESKEESKEEAREESKEEAREESKEESKEATKNETKGENTNGESNTEDTKKDEDIKMDAAEDKDENTKLLEGIEVIKI